VNDPFVILGVPDDADDEAIRRRYLEQVRTYTPEHHPERFAAIRKAYEQVRDLNRRVSHRLFEQGRTDSIDGIIEEITCRSPRRRPGLAGLTASLGR
jgi:curved DNA-binding protein CbpA